MQGRLFYRIIAPVIIMASKTNALRIVQQHKLPCREASYEYDEKDLSGLHAAAAIGMPPEQVFKTLVARGERTGINVFCIPVNRELDLKKAARAAGDKNMEMVPVKDLLGLTGYIRGGCSPIGMKKRYPTFLDASAQDKAEIAVSAGARGQQMILSPASIATLSAASYADLTK